MSELKPCPFCGGEIFVTDMIEFVDMVEVGATCQCCDMEFKHTQYFSYSKNARVALHPSFFDLFNRRADNGKH